MRRGNTGIAARNTSCSLNSVFTLQLHAVRCRRSAGSVLLPVVQYRRDFCEFLAFNLALANFYVGKFTESLLLEYNKTQTHRSARPRRQARWAPEAGPSRRGGPEALCISFPRCLLLLCILIYFRQSPRKPGEQHLCNNAPFWPAADSAAN